MMTLPNRYPSPLHLPFNRACLDGSFQLAAPDADPGGAGVWLAVQGSSLLVTAATQLPTGSSGWGEGLYLGSWEGRPCRLVEFAPAEPLPGGLRAESLTAAEPALPIELLTLGGLGRMILHWERHSCCCPTCGRSLQRLPGEWGKQCAVCASHLYPQVAPCAIVLVRRPGEVLLVRKPEWVPRRYGLVAGFIEFGEALEEAAAREVREETGVEIGNVRYLGSQCWPFPSQLMCGFVADWAGGDVCVDTTELADACWFPVDALPALPPKRSIARYLLDTELGLA
jgi:NAD+ diphosphatase